MKSVREKFGDIDIYLFDQILKNRFDNQMKILDAGCGSGRNLVYFLREGFEVYGIDQNPDAIENIPYSDGTSLKGEKVEFIPDKKDEILIGDNFGSFSEYTKGDGSFSIKIFKEQTGKLHSKMGFHRKDLEKCPEIKKAVVENTNSDWLYASTQGIEIKADQDISNIMLTFPFQSINQFSRNAKRLSAGRRRIRA